MYRLDIVGRIGSSHNKEEERNTRRFPLAMRQVHCSIDLVPFLLGQGVRLFDHLDAPIELESTEVIESTGVTHLTYRIAK